MPERSRTPDRPVHFQRPRFLTPPMLPIPQIIWHEFNARAARPARIPEPQTMEDPRPHAQAYMDGVWNGLPASARLEHWMLRAMRRTRN